MSSSSQAPPRGPVHFPHLSPYAILGHVPTKAVDIPVSAVFLVLFVCGAAFHMTTFQLNNRRNHKFVISAMTFGFCMSRIVTTTMRIVWACYPHDVSVAIASQVFNNAGVVLLYVINLIFAGRIFRSLHPSMQHNKIFNTAMKAYIASLVAVLVILITSVVCSFYTIKPHSLAMYGEMRKFGTLYFAVFSFAPFLLLAAAFAIPRTKDSVPLGKRGTLKTQVAVVLFTTLLCTFGAFFRAIIGFYPTPATNPGWYTSRAWFYITFFTFEILVVGTFALLRVDQRFHIPNKADRLAAWEAEKNGQFSDVEHGSVQQMTKAREVNGLDRENAD